MSKMIKRSGYTPRPRKYPVFIERISTALPIEEQGTLLVVNPDPDRTQELKEDILRDPGIPTIFKEILITHVNTLDKIKILAMSLNNPGYQDNSDHDTDKKFALVRHLQDKVTGNLTTPSQCNIQDISNPIRIQEQAQEQQEQEPGIEDRDPDPDIRI